MCCATASASTFKPNFGLGARPILSPWVATTITVPVIWPHCACTCTDYQVAMEEGRPLVGHSPHHAQTPYTQASAPIHSACPGLQVGRLKAPLLRFQQEKVASSERGCRPALAPRRSWPSTYPVSAWQFTLLGEARCPQPGHRRPALRQCQGFACFSAACLRVTGLLQEYLGLQGWRLRRGTLGKVTAEAF